MSSSDYRQLTCDDAEESSSTAETGQDSQFYQDILGTIATGIWVSDKSDIICYVNREMEIISGLTSEQMIGSDIMNCFPERTITYLTPFYYKAKTSLERTFIEPFPFAISQDSSTQPSGWLIPIVKEGRYAGMICTLEDVSTQKNKAPHSPETETSENDHASSSHPGHEATYENVIDYVGDMIIVTDRDGRIKRVNRTLKDFIQEPYQSILDTKWEPLLEKYEFMAMTLYDSATELLHKPTGRWFGLNTYGIHDSENGFSGNVVTLHEITEIRRISEELEKTYKEIDESRQMNQRALDEISSLIESVIQNKQINFSNPNLRKCYEVKNCSKTDCACHGKEAMRCWEVAGTYCGGKKQGAFAQKYKDCSSCEVYKKAIPNPLYEIGEQFNNMMHLLEVKNRELETAYEELKATQAQILQQEKMASIGQLAAGVAHEINNPMGFISSNLGTLSKYVVKLTDFLNAQTEVIAALVEDDALKDLNETRKKLKLDFILEDIEDLIQESLDGADRIKTIVQNLKSFSRVDEAEYKPADINECIESTLNIVWNELKYKASVNKEYGEIPPVKCFPQQLNQVFMNLLVNAAHAIEKQGEITIKTWDDEESIYISIADTGMGIPDDKISRIFDPFFTTKEIGKGTGLGLSIGYDIVKKHGGHITVDSKVGCGTTFTVTIPMEKRGHNG